MWYKKRTDKPGYDYFSHHVDDFLITGFGILANRSLYTEGKAPFHGRSKFKKNICSRRHEIVLS